MKRPVFLSATTTMLLSLVLTSTTLVTPAYSNTFHGLNTVLNKSVGTAMNPTMQDIRQNRLIPGYPLLSQALGEHGTVGLKISLTEQGTMSSAVVMSSSGFLRLDDAALEYVKANW